MSDLATRDGAKVRRAAAGLGCVLALIAMCESVQADNPPEGNTRLAGVSFAEITSSPDGQRVGIPQGGVDAFRIACDGKRPIWVLGREQPFQCSTASTSWDAMLDLPVQGLEAYTGQYLTRLVSTHEMHAIPLMESDAPLPKDVEAVLPPAYRDAKHSSSATQGALTLTFVPGKVYMVPGGVCRAVKTAVLAIREERATLLGELDTMPHAVADIAGIDGPVIWIDVGCIGQPASSLWRTQPTFASVASYVNGIENEPVEESSPAAPGAEAQRHKLAIDCSLAKVSPDTVICAHPELLETDQRIAESFLNLRTSYKGQDLDDLVDGQKHWLIERNDCHNKPTWQPYSEGEFGCLNTIMSRRRQRLEDLQLHRVTLSATVADYRFVDPAYLSTHAKAYVGKFVHVFGTLHFDDCGRAALGQVFWRSASFEVRSAEPSKESCGAATAYWTGTVMSDKGAIYLAR
jgi:hypothetical protein